MEWSPHQLVGVPCGALHFAGSFDVAADTAPEKEGLGHSVGGIEGGYADGEDDVEGCSGTEIDYADEASDACHHVDGIERDGGIGVHLL